MTFINLWCTSCLISKGINWWWNDRILKNCFELCGLWSCTNVEINHGYFNIKRANPDYSEGRLFVYMQRKGNILINVSITWIYLLKKVVLCYIQGLLEMRLNFGCPAADVILEYLVGMHGYPANYLLSGQLEAFFTICRASVSSQRHFYYLYLYPASKMLTDTDIWKN